MPGNLIKNKLGGQLLFSILKQAGRLQRRGLRRRIRAAGIAATTLYQRLVPLQVHRVQHRRCGRRGGRRLPLRTLATGMSFYEEFLIVHILFCCLEI